MWNATSEVAIPKKLIRLTRMSVEKPKSRVSVEEMLSASFQINNGLKQGDAMQS